MIFEVTCSICLLLCHFIGYKYVTHRFALRQMQMKYEERAQLLSRIEDLASLLLVDKEIGGELYKRLSEPAATPLLLPEVTDTVERKIHYFLRGSFGQKSRVVCNTAGSKKTTKTRSKVTCKKCLQEMKEYGL